MRPTPPNFMKLLVPVKRCVDYTVKIRVNAAQTGIDTNVKHSMNPFDEIAVEEAVRLREKHKEKIENIRLVSVGPPKASEIIRTGLAMGADDGLHVEVPESAPQPEPLAVAKTLAAVIRKDPVDMVIMGKQAIDGDNGMTGQMLAGLLGWGQATFASKVELLDGDKEVKVTREVDGGLEKMTVQLPAIITTDLRLNEPRYASLPNIMKAKKKKIDKITPVALGVDLSPKLETVKVTEPPKRVGGGKVDSVDELVTKLKAAGVMGQTQSQLAESARPAPSGVPLALPPDGLHPPTSPNPDAQPVLISRRATSTYDPNSSTRQSRMSSFFKGKRRNTVIESIDEFGRQAGPSGLHAEHAQASPTPLDPPVPSSSMKTHNRSPFSSLSLKPKNMRRFFRKRSWAPADNSTQEDPALTDIPARSETVQASGSESPTLPPNALHESVAADAGRNVGAPLPSSSQFEPAALASPECQPLLASGSSPPQEQAQNPPSSSHSIPISDATQELPPYVGPPEHTPSVLNLPSPTTPNVSDPTPPINPTAEQPFTTPMALDGHAVLDASSPSQPSPTSALPVIPAGTTMIIQGVVQAAEDSGSRSSANPNRSQPRVEPSTTGSSSGQANQSVAPDGERARRRLMRLFAPPASSASSDPPTPTGTVTDPPNPYSHAHLSGTFGNDNQSLSTNGGNNTQDSDNPGSAADLLGALLIAAASATANMLLSDPPNANLSSSAPTVAEASHPASSTNPGQTSADPPTTGPLRDAEEGVATPRTRSSVGVGPRPRPNTIVGLDGEADAYAFRDRPRPRSFMGAVRDRLFGHGEGHSRQEVERILRGYGDETNAGSSTEDTQDGSDPTTRDPIESLRERIASELMRALASREDESSTLSPPAHSDSPVPRRHSVAGPATSSAPLTQSTSMTTSTSSQDVTSTRAGALPAEGSFERFLHDTNTELRTTLLERMNRRDSMAPLPIPIIPSEPNTDSPSNGSTEQQATSTTRLVHRPPEGVIEPRLNWWRMHRFPARAVAAPPASPNAPVGIPASTSVATSSTPSPSNPSTSSGAAPTTGAPGQGILIPVIVVGIRTAPTGLVQEIGAMANNRPTGSSDVEGVTDASRDDTFSDAATAGAVERPLRPWSRAVESISRVMRRPERNREERETRLRDRVRSTFGSSSVNQADDPSQSVTESNSSGSPASTRDRTRNYLIWVIGGYYPESHPILTSPNIILNQFDQDDFWGLADLLGQVKPPVASKADIERANLEIIKAADISRYEKEGKVTSNTSEKCLICLSEYESDDDVRVMSCKHAFHQSCVDKWLEVGRNNCPACRSKGVEVMDSIPTTTADASTSTS
ncbi:hypothetical protein FRB99_003821 [Tulasnella sp. 403]|nr:hypothetical protein FRB99_003821 [Tulasnella sp. 403]